MLLLSFPQESHLLFSVVGIENANCIFTSPLPLCTISLSSYLSRLISIVILLLFLQFLQFLKSFFVCKYDESYSFFIVFLSNKIHKIFNYPRVAFPHFTSLPQPISAYGC